MYLVTGGAGFIGSHIADALVKQGKKVRVLDNFSTGKIENLKGILNKISLIRGDIKDKRTVKKSIKGVKYVLHQAALHSVPKSFDDPESFNAVNITGTLNLLLAAREAGVQRFVFASSGSVYGEPKRFPEQESFIPHPISPYAATKLMGEVYCRLFWEYYKLPTISLRYFNVFGPRQSMENKYAVVVPKFIISLLTNQSPPIYGDGKQSRDFTYINNVVQANMLSLKAKPASFGKVFNIACGRSYTILELLGLLNKLTGKNIDPIFNMPRQGDIRYTLADISRVRKYLNYKPNVAFKDGLKYSIEYFRGNVRSH